ncbi:hypothetical protein M23134_07048 [Microscilla marina ATCC 23134]|uniref:Uncharacterized protein n=1 Tax=Microscilla marina ATCC 23134 TaxID=313606 RepID=A1ZT63_MICM2|nr:hypothetical protein M23134_07048 [Microscilla marina ATCC 23134]
MHLFFDTPIQNINKYKYNKSIYYFDLYSKNRINSNILRRTRFMECSLVLAK